MARTKKEPNTIIVEIDGISYTFKCKLLKDSIKKQNKKGKVNNYNWEYYTVSVPTGELYENGRIKYKQIRAHDRAELYEKTKEYLIELHHPKPEKILVKDDIKAWMVEEKLDDMQATSYDSMEYIINQYIIPHIGECEVASVTTAQLKMVINKAKDSGLSRSIISKIRAYLLSYFKERININTQIEFKAVKMPKKGKIQEKRKELKKERKKKMFLEPSDVKAIQDVIYNGYNPIGYTRDLRPKEEREKDKEHPKRNSYVMPHQTFEQGIIFDFMLQTGLRASEMCALKFSDWDAKTQTLHINENRTIAFKRDTNGNIIGKEAMDRLPKTDASEDIIKLSKKANSIMQEMYDNDEFKHYVAHTKDGKPITKNELRGRWHRILRAAKVETQRSPSGGYMEEYGLHTIRHTYASLLYQKYKNIVLVSKKLRHTDPAFTARQYVDIMTSYENNVDEEFEV